MKQCGVYRIYCKVTSRSYIGSSIDIPKRFSWHRAVLRRNSPGSYGLTRDHSCQEDWNTFGEKAFLFEVIELCPEESLKEREQFWMDQPMYIDRYNLDVGARGERRCSEQTKQWMSEAAKERNARPEYKSMISERSKRQHVEGRLGWKTWKPKINKQIPKDFDKLREVLDVDFTVGYLFWKINSVNGKYRTGDRAGVFTFGRPYVSFDYQSLYIDNIVWYFYYGEWPEYLPEHIDGNLMNSSISNLRVKNGEGRPRSTYPGVK